MIELARIKSICAGLGRARSSPPVCGFEMGLLVYLVIPPVGWLIVAGWPQGLGRFGMQWQVLGLGIACASLLVLADGASLHAYCRWLKVRGVLPFLFWGCLWLALMGVVHGFLGLQLEGLLSGVLFLILFPVVCFAWTSVGVGCRSIFIFCVALLLVVENLFLSVYLWRGLGFGVEVLEGHWFPRIFLNIRDGNTIAVGASVAALALLVSSRMRWLGFWLMVAVFFNGWITAGRGLFLSVWFGVALVCFRAVALPCRRKQFFAMFLYCLAALACSWVIYFALSVAAGVDSGAFRSMIDRLADDAQFGRYGRLAIWSEWIRTGLAQDFLFGSGLGVRPILLDEPIFTPHNLFVQLLAEGGVFSLMMVVPPCVWILSRLLVGRGEDRLLYVYCLGALLVWLSVSAMLFWPAGVWLVSNLGSAFCQGNLRRSGISADFSGLRSLLIASVLMPLLVLFVSRKVVIWY